MSDIGEIFWVKMGDKTRYNGISIVLHWMKNGRLKFIWINKKIMLILR